MPLVSRSDSLVVWTGVCDDIIHTWTRVSLSLSLLVICVGVSPSTPSTVPQNTATTLRRYNSHRDSLVLHPPSTSSLTLSRLIGSVLSSAHSRIYVSVYHSRGCISKYETPRTHGVLQQPFFCALKNTFSLIALVLYGKD